MKKRLTVKERIEGFLLLGAVVAIIGSALAVVFDDRFAQPIAGVGAAMFGLWFELCIIQIHVLVWNHPKISLSLAAATLVVAGSISLIFGWPFWICLAWVILTPALAATALAACAKASYEMNRPSWSNGGVG